MNHSFKRTNEEGKEELVQDGSDFIHISTPHFIGSPKDEHASAKTVLIDVRCPTLSDYSIRRFS